MWEDFQLYCVSLHCLVRRYPVRLHWHADLLRNDARIWSATTDLLSRVLYVSVIADSPQALNTWYLKLKMKCTHTHTHTRTHTHTYIICEISQIAYFVK